MNMSSERRIVLLGKTGAGKSSLANTIFGEEVFNIGHTANSETKKGQAKTRCVNGRSITLIDTPGFFDTNRPEEELKEEIVRCIIECAPGLHAFLIVLDVRRFTEHEQAVIKKIQQHFSEEVFKYATVVFTHGDQLPKGQKIEDYFLQNKPLSDLVRKCGSRCHVIDNQYWNKKKPKDKYRSNRFQVQELLNTIEATVMENNGSCYTNEMVQTVEEEIQQEEDHVRQSSGNMTDKKIKKQAKVGVFKKLLIKFAGIGIGALLGALFGAVVGVVGTVAIAFKKDEVLRAVVKNPVAVVGAAAAVGAGVGAVVGGVIGYQAAEGAGSPMEAAEAVYERAQSAVKKACDVCSELVQQKLKYS